MSVEVERPLDQANYGVFKPDKDPLVIRGTIGNVFDESQKLKTSRSASRVKVRKFSKPLLSDVPQPAILPPESNLNLPTPRALQETSPRRSSRPLSKSSSRFGAYSQASFFSRHNPHPFRVRHISGLNGQPICSVQDHDVEPLRRFSIRTPSTREREKIFQAHLPANALGLSSTTFPINIITGLQHYPFREKAIPRIGLIPVTDFWRDELRELCLKAGLIPDIPVEPPRPPTPPSILPQTKRRTVYSVETGRIVPPPSRAMSRQASRQGYLSNVPYGHYQHIAAYPDTETMMLEMLCQILQTDSVQAVQQWLVSSGNREKSLVLDMIKSAMTSEEEVLRQQEAEKQEALAAAARTSRPPTVQPTSRLNTAASITDRTPIINAHRTASATGMRQATSEFAKPVKTEKDGAEILTFDKPQVPASPRKTASARPLGTPSRPASRKALNEISPTMRYTKTPTGRTGSGRVPVLPAIHEATENTHAKVERMSAAVS